MTSMPVSVAAARPHLQPLSNLELTHGPSRFRQYQINFMSGGVALAFAYAVMHPLDTFKTRIQAAAVSSSASVPRMTSLLTRETLSVLGKGFVASVSGAAPQGALRLATYELTKGYLLQQDNVLADKGQQLSQVSASAASATVGDLASSVAKVPREVITTRLQAGTASSTNDALQHVLRTEGVRGLFRGFWSTTLRDVPFMVILFTTYENFKMAHQRGWRPFGAGSQNGHDVTSGVPTLPSIVFGGVSGAFAGFLTTPFDVIKTRVMTATRSTLSGHHDAALPTRHALTVSWAARGIYAEATRGSRPSVTASVSRAFFAGAVPRSVWWFCICGLFFPVYEQGKEVLGKLYAAPATTVSNVSSNSAS